MLPVASPMIYCIHISLSKKRVVLCLFTFYVIARGEVVS